ncbi:4-hydroxy-3-methylbut-2-enyl diphosphate reductase [Novosphingobium sp. JCM 18896]|uniref:4-hydroxy-3-methylbut-2-enyl diphosphate reductase n=1 Tax=Novosphingobium sp. JCM 18896 TaxID=2989731 RepID=UPI002222552F|nr:4-hydroxy-3-methylbut-2-enyl diphosphate reductase [Novosphingobium sp. JCM 18896]MCW1430864.1 4-hydroxy-3-methylbut-2-enyl diphosphate reductase [Novosphingobium sp. JCM 18896]
MKDDSESAAQAHITGERRLLLASPRGFCAGVERAIETVEQALARHGTPVYVRRAIVHNRSVVRSLEDQGAIFVQEIDEIPKGAIAILSAHGSAKTVKRVARKRELRVVDAICPLVAKVHAEVEGWFRQGRHVLLIGHVGHPEIVGTLGQVPAGAISVLSQAADLDGLGLPTNTAVAYAVQTTFAAREADDVIAAIKTQFADCVGPRSSDICYATTNRQAAIEAIAPGCDLVIVVGDAMSSNGHRLVEVSRAAGCAQVQLVSDPKDIAEEILLHARTIGLTAAASTPESAISLVIDHLQKHGFEPREVPGLQETVRFKPVALEWLDGISPSASMDERATRLRRDVDTLLDAAIGNAPGRSDRLAEALRYACIGVGKRFRTMLVAAVAELVGGSYRQALRIGAAIECVHAQSLIHDDLPCMDDDDLRRGRPTLHRKFDEATAVLAGEALLALAFEILADPRTHPDGARRAKLVLSLSRAVGQDGLAGGQMMDLFPPTQPSRDYVLACEARKTGAVNRRANGDRDRRAIGDQGLMRAYAVAGWRRA